MIDGTNYITQQCACGCEENSTKYYVPKKSAKEIVQDATSAIDAPQFKHYANNSIQSKLE